jgi:hypothetical protein
MRTLTTSSAGSEKREYSRELVLAPVHRKQLLTYLRLADKRLGLLINFHVALIKDGITRIVNGLEEDDHAKSPSRKEP